MSLVAPYRETLRTYMPYRVQLELRKKCGDRIKTTPEGLFIVELPETCVLDLEREVIIAAVRELREAPRLRVQLNRHLADLTTKIASFDNNIARSREMAKYLRATRQ